MKQSAVEWLAENVDNLIPFMNNYIAKKFNELVEQAKDMERQQLIDCGNSCALMQHIHNDKINKMTESKIRQFAEEEHLTFGEKYFNENFKKL
jgi:hypothetical protein